MHNGLCKAAVCLLVMIVIGCGQDSKSVSDQVKSVSDKASQAASKAADKTHPNAVIYVDRESAALLSAETKAALGASV